MRLKHDNDGRGTGSIVPGHLLKETWHSHQVFITNNHVVSTTYKNAMHPKEVEIVFEAHDSKEDASRPYRVKEVLWESPIEYLDTTYVLLDQPVPKVPGLRMADRVPGKEGIDRIYIAGYPRGAGLRLSIRDNRLIAANDTRIRYRSPTEEGSSGSPVFNEALELIAIHHEGHENRMVSLKDSPRLVWC